MSTTGRTRATARHCTRLTAALAVAAMVHTAPVPVTTATGHPPAVTVDIANASLTDALYRTGEVVQVLASTVGIHVDAAISVPFETGLAVLAATRDPELRTNVASYLAQRFVNPAVGDPIHAYPWQFRQSIAELASLFAYPLGPGSELPGLILRLSQAVAAGFDGVLGSLADPLPGLSAVTHVAVDTLAGRVVTAANAALRAPLYALWNTINYLGMLPANVAAVIQSGIATPSQLPGYVSYLVSGLLSPDPQVGLFGRVLDNVVDPFKRLSPPTDDDPAPLASRARDKLAQVVDRLLSRLPAPIAPQDAHPQPQQIDPGPEPTGAQLAVFEVAAPAVVKPYPTASDALPGTGTSALESTTVGTQTKSLERADMVVDRHAASTERREPQQRPTTEMSARRILGSRRGEFAGELRRPVPALSKEARHEIAKRERTQRISLQKRHR